MCTVYMCTYVFNQIPVWIFQLSMNLLKLVAVWKETATNNNNHLTETHVSHRQRWPTCMCMCFKSCAMPRIPQSPGCWGYRWGPKMAFHFHPTPRNHNLQRCWPHQLHGTEINQWNDVRSILMLLKFSLYWPSIHILFTHTHTHSPHLVSRQSRIWALLLV